MHPALQNLMDSLNDVAPDCFDCGLQVDKISADTSSSPLTILIDFHFDPYTGEEEYEQISLPWAGTLESLEAWSDQRAQLENDAVEAFGETVDEYRW